MSVGVMKDYKLRNLHASHTVYYESIKREPTAKPSKKNSFDFFFERECLSLLGTASGLARQVGLIVLFRFLSVLCLSCSMRVAQMTVKATEAPLLQQSSVTYIFLIVAEGALC
jgi:hypothetical protein